MNVGKEETHNELVVKPAKEFLKDDYSQVEAMNKAFKPISNVYMSKLELLNETTDGKAAKAFEPFRGTREKPEGVKCYDEQKLNLDTKHILGLKNALEMLKNKKDDEQSEKYKVDLLERIKLKGIDSVYNETEQEIRENNPGKEDKINYFLKANKDDYEKKLRILNETPDGKKAKEFEPFLGTREKPDDVKHYDEQKLNLDADYIFSILVSSSITI